MNAPRTRRVLRGDQPSDDEEEHGRNSCDHAQQRIDAKIGPQLPTDGQQLGVLFTIGDTFEAAKRSSRRAMVATRCGRLGFEKSVGGRVGCSCVPLCETIAMGVGRRHRWRRRLRQYLMYRGSTRYFLLLP